MLKLVNFMILLSTNRGQSFSSATEVMPQIRSSLRAMIIKLIYALNVIVLRAIHCPPFCEIRRGAIVNGKQNFKQTRKLHLQSWRILAYNRPPVARLLSVTCGREIETDGLIQSKNKSLFDAWRSLIYDKLVRIWEFLVCYLISLKL